MSYFHALLLSLVEGVTEFLPISSTGHLVLASQLLHIPQTDFVKSFEIIIQLGAILAVVWLYWQKIVTNKKTWKPIALAFLPTAIIGFILYKLIKHYLLGNILITVAALGIGGIVLLVFEKLLLPKRNTTQTLESMSAKDSIFIGICQSLSVVPGVSRAAATIVGGLWVGLSRDDAVEFSFLLAIPTLSAATGLDLVKSGWSFSATEIMLLVVGFGGAFFSALFAIRYFLRFIKTHTFVPFGIYRIVLAIAYLLLVRLY